MACCLLYLSKEYSMKRLILALLILALTFAADPAPAAVNLSLNSRARQPRQQLAKTDVSDSNYLP